MACEARETWVDSASSRGPGHLTLLNLDFFIHKVDEAYLAMLLSGLVTIYIKSMECTYIYKASSTTSIMKSALDKELC